MIFYVWLFGWIAIVIVSMMLTKSDHNIAYGPTPWMAAILLGWVWPVVLPICIALVVLYFGSRWFIKIGAPLRRKLNIEE